MHFAGYVIHEKDADLRALLDSYDAKEVEPYPREIVGPDYYNDHPWINKQGQYLPVEWSDEKSVREYLDATSPWIDWDEEVMVTDDDQFALLSRLNPLYQYDWFVQGGRWSDWMDALGFGFDSQSIPFPQFWSALQSKVEPEKKRMNGLYDRFIEMLEAEDRRVLHLPAGEFNASELGQELTSMIPSDLVEGWWIPSAHWFYWVKEYVEGSLTKNAWVASQLPYLTSCFVDHEGYWYGSGLASELERAQLVQFFLDYCSENEHLLSDYHVTLVDFHR